MRATWSAQSERTLSLGPLSISPLEARVTKHGKTLPLSIVEYRLLLLFATNPNRIITRDMMCEALWESANAYVEENTLYVYMRRLREKIEDDPAVPRIIGTVRGVGYRSLVSPTHQGSTSRTSWSQGLGEEARCGC